MGGKNAPKVYDFLLSIHYGLCHGPIDRLNKVWIKDKSVLCGDYTARQDIVIDQPELFGGDDGEGGVKGVMEFYQGTADQVSSAALAARVGRTPDRMPGYRGLASLFFRGNGANGWRWTTNNPYLPGVAASVTRNPRTLGSANAEIFPVANTDESGQPVSAAETWVTVSDDFSQRGTDLDINGTINPDTFDGAPGAKTGPFADWTNLSETLDMIADRDASGGELYWIARQGYGLATAVRDFPISSFGITPEIADNGETRLEGRWIGLRGGLFATATYTIVALDENYNSLSTMFTENESLASDDPQHNGVIETGPLPVGTRHLRIQVTSQNAKIYPRELQVQWNGQTVNFCDPDDEGLRLLPNANPAHIIHEVMTNREWGKGEDPLLMDVASFEAAAQIYKDEFLGIALQWVRQGSIKDFIQQILDHTNSMFFINPRTGLWTLKPLRDDYDASSARLLSPSNCVARKRKRRAWGETVNEIIVKYTDPQTEEEATVSAHNLANIAIQGGVISETRPYPGIRDGWVAQRIAERDVIEAGWPLYSAEIEADRSFWDVTPGEVLRFTWPEDGVSEMVVRVMKVDYGSPTDRTIKMSIAEDVFALERTASGPVQTSEWASQRAAPEPFEAEMAMAAPLPMLIRSGFDLTEIEASYPVAAVMLLGTDDDGATVEFAVHTEVTRNDGSTAIEPVANLPPARSLQLQAPLVAEASTALDGSFISGLTLDSAESGDLLLIGDSEDNHEIAMLGGFDSTAGTWTVWRGLYDTVPSAWPLGSRIWVLPEVSGQSDPSERSGGENVTYRLLPRTSEGRLAYGLASDLDYTATERAHLPFRPANCQIAANGFAVADFTTTPVSFPVPVSWANRDRTVEDQVAMKWTDSNVTPESGQTTVIRVFDDTDTLAGEVTGLTGTAHDMTSGNFFGVTYGYLEFVSERDGLRSRPGARRWFDMRQGGYGNNYGVSYG